MLANINQVDVYFIIVVLPAFWKFSALGKAPYVKNCIIIITERHDVTIVLLFGIKVV